MTPADLLGAVNYFDLLTARNAAVSGLSGVE